LAAKTVITMIEIPVMNMIAASTGCINFLKWALKEKIITASNSGDMIPKRMNQNMVFCSGNRSASKKANIPKKNIANISENRMGFRDRL
jgi:hypothetical protein